MVEYSIVTSEEPLRHGYCWDTKEWLHQNFDDYASKINNLLSNKKLNSDYGSENKNFD